MEYSHITPVVIALIHKYKELRKDYVCTRRSNSITCKKEKVIIETIQSLEKRTREENANTVNELKKCFADSIASLSTNFDRQIQQIQMQITDINDRLMKLEKKDSEDKLQSDTQKNIPLVQELTQSTEPLAKINNCSKKKKIVRKVRVQKTKKDSKRIILAPSADLLRECQANVHSSVNSYAFSSDVW
ncbi:hypothetical protein ROZALSC1DRAFT_28946 [Rozella allomycis CSF55]|uniref:Uncharacterized protein n=1 Tax=Rozella allomycis (strain CSF55) TaxID=988480 RepID=A0A075AYA9_ROZAC|nr:hypothetical protein O9G_000658 [Rozella allomycis CSF55]RKP19453.1 hypothetical protein ROZALSC1DRAFT_28946 [Rozella allomycis CSF55]|eukprot:EPZ35262.1 hypothetical protein O9G_000658 [Rozella allomycis CSF55]